MELKKLYNLESGDSLSYLESQELNKILASTSVEEIPNEQVINVKEYLESAFAVNSIKIEQNDRLVKLLEDLKVNLEGS